ncbi:hypothetical protein [Marinobacter sp.]|uniref:hypothetical protein n=1 Tax=Marinobacter sp. TaxID=50741 RepID=UPI00384B8721
MKDSVNRQIEHLASEGIPALRELIDDRLGRLRAKLDLFNRSLADRALPENRKGRVGRLALERKAKLAGQKKAAGKASRKSGKKASS